MSDVKELIERVRGLAKQREHVETFEAGFDCEMDVPVAPVLSEAAAALERLSAERDEAREALRRIIRIYTDNAGRQNEKLGDIPAIARAALKAEPVEP